MHVTSLGAAREIQEGIAVDPLLVGCGVKPHDFDFSFKKSLSHELLCHEIPKLIIQKLKRSLNTQSPAANEQPPTLVVYVDRNADLRRSHNRPMGRRHVIRARQVQFDKSPRH
jgi:hypothetical protein